MKENNRFSFCKFRLHKAPTIVYFPGIKKTIFAVALFAPLIYLTSFITGHLFSSKFISNIADGVFLFLLPCVLYIIKKVKNIKLPLFYDYYLYGSCIWALIMISSLIKDLKRYSVYKPELIIENYFMIIYSFFLAIILVTTTAIYLWENIKTNRYQIINQNTDYSTQYSQNLHQDYVDVEDQKKAAGAKGEKDVAFQLKFLPHEYKVFNDINIYSNNLKSQIDHLVIGPTGIYHLETKNYSGRIVIDSYGQWFRQKYDNAPELLENPSGQLERHHETILGFLKKRQMGNSEEIVYPVFVSASISTKITGHKNFPYPIWRVDNLLSNIKNCPFVLSENQIEKLYEMFKVL
jgi:hypothetical protein